jgi:AraC family transcriptional regulator of adaptative response / DNA-3-methyladenine glycosylase II
MTDRGELAESLVARMRSTPSGYPDVTALAREAGAGRRDLDTLFHEHYHAAAADVQRRIRVDAGFGDDADFLAVHAMPRAAWDRLGRAKSFTLTLPRDFHAAVPLRWLGRDAESRTERVNGRSAVKALLLDGTPALLQIELHDLQAVCRVDRPVSREGMRAAHAAAVRMLGLSADPAPFERRATRDAGVRRLIAGRRGLRVPLTSTLFEALVWTIAGQQVNLSFAYRLRRVVLDLAGKPVDGFVAHPDAAAVARLDYDDLTRRQWSRRKAEYVIDVARSVADGTLDAEELLRAPAGQVRERLESLRGFGVWSANYVMMRGCGLADCVPLGDSGLATALEHFHGLDHRPDREETDALMQPFRPYRSLATFHFWVQS